MCHGTFKMVKIAYLIVFLGFFLFSENTWMSVYSFLSHSLAGRPLSPVGTIWAGSGEYGKTGVSPIEILANRQYTNIPLAQATGLQIWSKLFPKGED